jgi:hypothetical protein
VGGAQPVVHPEGHLQLAGQGAPGLFEGIDVANARRRTARAHLP